MGAGLACSRPLSLARWGVAPDGAGWARAVGGKGHVNFLYSDWINDDMPHPVNTSTGNLTAMPLAWDLSDQRLLFQQHMATEECVEQVLRAFKTLYAEAADTGSGRILTLTFTPWLMGQPHRIRALGTMRDRILDRAGVWPATGAEIVDAWRPSTGS